ncbi:hypothetical protein THIOSC15_450002 [uncultured Thiomicrorhabdus sp.]
MIAERLYVTAPNIFNGVDVVTQMPIPVEGFQKEDGSFMTIADYCLDLKGRGYERDPIPVGTDYFLFAFEFTPRGTMAFINYLESLGVIVIAEEGDGLETVGVNVVYFLRWSDQQKLQAVNPLFASDEP